MRKKKKSTDSDLLNIVKKFLHDFQVVHAERTIPVQSFFIKRLPPISPGSNNAGRIIIEGYKLQKWELKNDKGGNR